MRRGVFIIGITVALAIFLASTALAGFDPKTGTISSERWRSGVPLGGIGCGDVELYTDGAFGSATINNNWDRPTGLLRGAFLAVWMQDQGKTTARMLRGASREEYPGVPNVADTHYTGWYPTAHMDFDDAALPLTVTLDAFSPIIPHNVADSSLPVAVFTVTFKNETDRRISASALMSWPNIIGTGGDRANDWTNPESNYQEDYASADGLAGLKYLTRADYGNDPRQNTVGQYLLVTSRQGADRVSTCPMWDAGGDGISFWEHFATDGSAGDVTGVPVKSSDPAGAVASRVIVEAKSSKQVRFVLVWRMPNLIMVHDEQHVTDDVQETSAGLGAAVDGNPQTRWSPGRPQTPGDAFQVDLGRETEVQRIALDSHASPNDYPHGYRIETSLDGQDWKRAAEGTPAEAARQQLQGLLALDFPVTKCRYVRITCLGEDSFYWWSIYELRLAGPGGQIRLEAGMLRSYVRRLDRARVTRNVGHYYENRFPDVESIAQYVWPRAHGLYMDTSELWQSPVKDASNLPMWLKLKLVNCAFSMTECTILTKDGTFSVLESPVDMTGALGTMDQRMAAHAFYTQFFPELDRNELELFAKCQQKDGRITHFVGNVHEVIGDPNVGYGVTDWPDLSSAWTLQVLKLYRWTGDREFLLRMWPHVQLALAWLKSADTDGDLIPEGGSTYDYEQMPRGAFIYNASCYLGALRGAHDIATSLADGESDPAAKAEYLRQAQGYAERFAAVQKAVIKQLWTGDHFIKWRDPKSNKTIPNTFVSSLAGDWLSRLSGAGRTLSPAMTNTTTEELIARHADPFHPVPPMEVTPDIKPATGTCFLLQHEPYLGCEAIYEGYVDEGLDVIKRVYQVAWEQNKSPWNQSLCYNAPDGGQGGLVRYMTCPTTWHVLNALSGITVDLPAQTMWLNPRVPSEMGYLRIPVNLSTCSLWLFLDPKGKQFTLTVKRVFGDRKDKIVRLITDIDRPAIMLPQPFEIKEGAVLDLSAQYDELHLQTASRPMKMNFIAQKASRPGLPTDKWAATSIPVANRADGDKAEAKAFDDAIGTRWTTGRPMQPDDWYQLDLGELRRFSAVEVDNDGDSHDWPRGLSIEVSADGKTWTRVATYDEHQVRSACHKGIYHYDFAPREARYIKLVQLGNTSYWWWSLHEIYVRQ